MAFIYRYHIDDEKTRNEVILKNYSEDIIRTIEDQFKENLKDYRVEERFFEFKLHYSISNQLLQSFGKQLQQNSEGLRSIWHSIKKMNKQFFSRMLHEYYLFSVNDENGILRSVELVDLIDLNETERFTAQAKKDLKKYLARHEITLISREHDDAIARAFYLDVFSFKVDDVSYKKHLKCFESEENIGLLLVKGRHVRKTDKTVVITEQDMDQLTNPDIAESLYLRELKDISKYDGFEVISVEKVNEKDSKRIRETMDLHIGTATSITNCGPGFDDDMNFTVHNVGQALCTSLSGSKKTPFLYFDFGISDYENKFNRPEDMTIDVSGKPLIVLSHIHKDHWCGLTAYTKAFECNWYIPKQDLEALFNKRCAEIFVRGGKVSYVDAPIVLSWGTIFTCQNSRHKLTRMPENKHDNGIAMHITLYPSEMANINILLAGDQRYDYMPEEYLKDIDVLVASHHGGTYSWSTRENVCEDIPLNTKNGIVIYSYGKDNTYDHPSAEDDYKCRGWNESHKTERDLDFRIGSSYSSNSC